MTQFGSYLLEERLAVGGMVEVFRVDRDLRQRGLVRFRTATRTTVTVAQFYQRKPIILRDVILRFAPTGHCGDADAIIAVRPEIHALLNSAVVVSASDLSLDEALIRTCDPT